MEMTRNQKHNVKHNSSQTEARRVLTLCSAGLLRSPTTAKFLGEKYGFNCRAAGMVADYALVPATKALVYWADEIVCVNEDTYQEFLWVFKDSEDLLVSTTIQVLDIPDIFDWCSPELIKHIETQYDPTMHQE